MIAALPMYDMAHARGATDRFWCAIAERLPEAPASLTRGVDPWQIWQDDTLLLAQTCGLPLRARLDGKVTLVGTPDPQLPGCTAGTYCSVVVVAKDSPHKDASALAKACLAYNDPLSQSGWANARALNLGQGPTVETGAHAASAKAVAEGNADLACIDAVTWQMLQIEAPDLTARLRTIGTSPPVPTLPYITAKHRDPAPIAAAVSAAIKALSPTDRKTLHIYDLIHIPIETYRNLPIPNPPLHLAQ